MDQWGARGEGRGGTISSLWIELGSPLTGVRWRGSSSMRRAQSHGVERRLHLAPVVHELADAVTRGDVPPDIDVPSPSGRSVVVDWL